MTVSSDVPAVPPARRPALSVSADARVPLRRQLAAQIAADLRAGRWTDGDRLPSVRDLSRRLGVHRDTVRAAYRELADEKLVDVRPGSGVYAGRARRAYGAGAATGRALRGFLARERAAGRSARELAGLLGRWREATAARRVVVVGRDAELLAVWEAEAREALAPSGVEVAGVTLERAREEPGVLATGVVAAGPASRPEATALAPPWTEVVGLRPGLPDRVRRLLLRVPAGTVLAAVSRSRRLLSELSALAAGVRGGDVAVAAVAPGDRRLLGRRARVARFVLVDVTCREAVAGRVPDVRRLTLRHLATAELGALARYLGEEPAVG